MTKLPRGFAAPVALGQGGEAKTFLCWQGDPGRWVVLKIGDAAGAARLRKEAQLLESLAGGPVPALLGQDLSGRAPWIALTWIDGLPLDAIPEEFGAPSRKAIVLQATLAVARLHGAQVVHGDLSASNLVVRPHGEVAVLDFGLSPVPGSPDAPSLGGAWEIMPPERLRGAGVDPRWDVFALGVLGARLLGVSPSWNGSRDEWTADVASGEAAKGLRGRSYALSLALDPDPSARPADAAALLRLLEREWGDPPFARDLCAAFGARRLEGLFGQAVLAAQARGDWESAWRLQRERIERAQDPEPLMPALGEFQRKRQDPPARRRLRTAATAIALVATGSVFWWHARKSGDAPSELEQTVPARADDEFDGLEEPAAKVGRAGGTLVFDPPPPGASLLVDGRPTDIPPDGFLVLPPGARRVVLRDSLGLGILDTTMETTTGSVRAAIGDGDQARKKVRP